MKRVFPTVWSSDAEASNFPSAEKEHAYQKKKLLVRIHFTLSEMQYPIKYGITAGSAILQCQIECTQGGRDA